MFNKDIKIAPSILSANFSKIGEEVIECDKCGADLIHLDVMDGVFVKNITFGPKFIKDIRPLSKNIFDAHLMIVEPWKYVEKFADAGSDFITVHYEACKDKLLDTLKLIKSFNVKCGAVINPDTPVEAIKPIIEECDMVLLMSVFPGFGGQKFIPEVLEKIKQVRQIIDSTGKDIDLEIDGGVTKENVQIIKESGANVIVAGNTIFKELNRKKIIDDLRNI